MKPKGHVATKSFLLNLGLKAWPIKRLERRRNKRLKAKRIRHYDVCWGYRFALQDLADLYHPCAQRWIAVFGWDKVRQEILKGLNCPMKYADNAAMHKDTDDYWCPHRQDSKKADLNFQEQLKDFKNKEELDRIYNDYWSQPWGLMDEWSGKHYDDWGWDEIDYKILERFHRA